MGKYKDNNGRKATQPSFRNASPTRGELPTSTKAVKTLSRLPGLSMPSIEPDLGLKGGFPFRLQTRKADSAKVNCSHLPRHQFRIALLAWPLRSTYRVIETLLCHSVRGLYQVAYHKASYLGLRMGSILNRFHNLSQWRAT